MRGCVCVLSKEIHRIPNDRVVVVRCLIHVVLRSRLHSQHLTGLADEDLIEGGSQGYWGGKDGGSACPRYSMRAFTTPGELRKTKGGDSVVGAGHLGHLLRKSQGRDEGGDALSGGEGGIEPGEGGERRRWKGRGSLMTGTTMRGETCSTCNGEDEGADAQQQETDGLGHGGGYRAVIRVWLALSSSRLSRLMMKDGRARVIFSSS